MSQRQPSCRALSLSVLVALGVGFSGASQAQAAPNFPVTAQQKSTAQQVAQAGVAQAADQAASRPQDLTRAEVVADFNLWHRAGLDQFMNTPGFDFNSAEYHQALAVYQSLRSGPAYAEELAKVRAAAGSAR